MISLADVSITVIFQKQEIDPKFKFYIWTYPKLIATTKKSVTTSFLFFLKFLVMVSFVFWEYFLFFNQKNENVTNSLMFFLKSFKIVSFISKVSHKGE